MVQQKKMSSADYDKRRQAIFHNGNSLWAQIHIKYVHQIEIISFIAIKYLR